VEKNTQELYRRSWYWRIFERKYSPRPNPQLPTGRTVQPYRVVSQLLPPKIGGINGYLKHQESEASVMVNPQEVSLS